MTETGGGKQLGNERLFQYAYSKVLIRLYLNPLDHSNLVLQIDLVLTLEGMLKRFNLLNLFPPIEVQKGPILINASKTFSDGYHTTGREIAEAIKPQAVSSHNE